MSKPDSESSFKKRDGLIFQLLGWFFVVFGLLVWAGLFWPQATEGRIVNGIAGAALLMAGGGALYLARYSSR